MSTFDGLIKEFPGIRIDYFRNHPNKRPPAACFLSHAHSDHLVGLDTLKMPFVYCSATTRRILLQMEKYPNRINFSRGILEARRQTYKHLKLLLKPLPLQTPVDLELQPKERIRVNLFDANHCPGSVMFLIEGHGRAILYTGDIRAESWWVNSITRSPILIPYVTKQRHLDCMYLDTTFASHRDVHREFPSKAEGISELMKKISRCPADSIFYFRAWTLGYEDVWIAMSNFLGTRIHVDPYQLRLFRGIGEDGIAADYGPALAGFQVGNSEQAGCLTTNSDARVHSCEPGLPCHTALSEDPNIVWIAPVVSRMPDGAEVAEVGAGGGKGDLYHSRELDMGSGALVQALRSLVSALGVDGPAAYRLEDLIQKAVTRRDHRMVLDSLGTDPSTDLSVKEFVRLLLQSENSDTSTESRTSFPMPYQRNVIHFPYSRHSSYSELRDLVRAFQPKDICPCTTDVDSWTGEVSIEALFGDLCSERDFKYDKLIRQEVQQRNNDSSTTIDEATSQQPDTQQTGSHVGSPISNAIPQNVKERQATSDVTLEEISLPATSAAEENAKERFREAWNREGNGPERYISTRLIRDNPPIENRNRLLNSDSATIGHVTHYEEGGRFEDDDCLDNLYCVAGTLIGARKRAGDSRDKWATEEEQACSSSSTEASDCIDFERRFEAFEAARTCLETGDAVPWIDLSIQSLGVQGHEISSPEL